MNTWFVSDTHFGHVGILAACRPQFSSVEEMDEIMIENWNRVVRPCDRVYHLGDFAWTTKIAKRVRLRLNGTIRLVVGNHDKILELADARLFQRMYMWRIFEDEGFTATHLPMRVEQIRHGIYNVHGHIHAEPAPEPFHHCVCVEQTNFTPVALEDLRTSLGRRL